MQTVSRHVMTGAAPRSEPGKRWNVEIHLSPGGIVRERTWAEDWRAAIEAALARSFIVPAQVNGIVAYPAASPAA